MYVCCECCVLSGRGLCDELITRPEESYRLWRLVVCDQDTSKENVNLLKPNDIYIYMSYRSANLQTLHFKYLFNKYTY